MVEHSRPNKLIKIDKHTNKVLLPSILLETRSGKVLGKISDYDNFNMSMVAIGVDEVSFDVHKYVDGVKCSIWSDLVDLKIIELQGYGRFQIKVSYTDNTQTIKSVQGQSLEVELGQLALNNFHINDEEDADMQQDEHTAHKYDSKGNFIPVVFYNKDNPDRSLLHLVLKDKAPHWSIGHVPTYVSRSEADDVNAELSNKFMRVYTEDGTSIYDFLTGTVAEETNVVFTFDTLNRVINCYNLFECKIDGKIVGNPSADVIGEDTLVFGSKKNFVNEVSIESNQDQVKNCFRVEGGDDTITSMIAAVNMNGTNYIWKFSDFQFSDMSDELQKAIKDYQEEMSLQSTKDEYYGENGIYTKLCEAYEQLYLKKSTMMPSLTTVEVGTAEEQYNNIINGLNTSTVYVSNINNYSSSAFTGVTNQVESFATILMDSRFEIEVVEGSTSFSYNKETDTYGIWKGKIKITQRTDETNTYPVIIENSAYVSVKIGNGKTEDGEIEYMRQKVQKALAKQDMANLDFSFTDSDKEIRSYFEQFSLNRLKSFYDAYNECISILAELVSTNKSDIAKDLYNEYYRVLTIIDRVKDTRQKEVDAIDSEISTLESKQRKFQEDHDFQKHLEKYGENLYKEFCMYRREDTYSNPNYTSDSLETTTELLNKAKELMEVADSELSKACMLQRTVSTSLSNLLILPEFEPLYDSFALFNYIRVKTDDEILKLRLIGVDFSGDSIENINVTFSEKVETIDGKVSDTESILQQAASIATSYSSTVKQAKQGELANKEFVDIYSNGLNATKAMLSNNDKNEVTMTGAGLLAKRMDDAGYYGEKQLRITGNGMYLTDDAWKSLKMAVGEIIYTNPITGEEEKNYGIIASTIIGELIAGKQMHIGNENGSVKITGEGIEITNGTITWGDGEDGVNAPSVSDIDGLDEEFDEFKTDVAKILTGGSKTTIGSDYVISPKIGGGYLYIANNDYSVEIDPNHTNSNSHGDYLFCVKDKSKTTNNIIMGVTNNGDGYFSGEITANTGKIANFNINSNALYTDNATFSNTTGLYLGSSGLRIGDKFKVNIDGTALIYGNIYTNGSLNMLFYHNEAGYYYNQYKEVLKSYIEGNQTEGFSLGIQVTHSTKFSSEVAVYGSFYGYGGGYIVTSDKNVKHDIKELDKIKSSEFIYSLKPSKFKYNNGTSNRYHHGLIAQEVKESLGSEDNAVYVEQKNGIKGIRYEELIADIIATVQTLNERLSNIENK